MAYKRNQFCLIVLCLFFNVNLYTVAGIWSPITKDSQKNVYYVMLMQFKEQNKQLSVVSMQSSFRLLEYARKSYDRRKELHVVSDRVGQATYYMIYGAQSADTLQNYIQAYEKILFQAPGLILSKL